MIYRLLDLIAKAQPPGFPDIAVGSMPATAPPHIVLYPGTVTASRTASDTPGEPRPLAWQEDIKPVQGATSYKLAKTPLAGTPGCQAVYDQGLPEERVTVLMETDDYTVDLITPAILITAAGATKLATAAILRVSYSFVGVQGVQEFTQLFYADILASTVSEAEQWSSLLIGLMLTGHDALIQKFNAAGGYQSGDMVSRHFLDSFGLMEGNTTLGASGVTARLTFEAKGQLQLGRETAPDFGLIEKIVSPGRTSSSRSVDIEVKMA